MNDSGSISFDDFVANVRAQHTRLQSKVGSCWVCGTPTTNWGVIFPGDEQPDGLGFGAPSKDKNVRVIWFPCCVKHGDPTDEQIAQCILPQLKGLRDGFRN